MPCSCSTSRPGAGGWSPWAAWSATSCATCTSTCSTSRAGWRRSSSPTASRSWRASAGWCSSSRTACSSAATSRRPSSTTPTASSCRAPTRPSGRAPGCRGCPSRRRAAGGVEPARAVATISAMGLRSDSEGLFGDDPFGAGPERAPEPDPGRVLSVSELSRAVQGALQGLGRVRVEGEVSRVTRAASGHLYFDLKDLDAKLACTVWRSALPTALRFELEEGQRVVAHGKLDVWPPRGSYSLIVQRLEPRGLGALRLELERLKETLRARGWFDRHRPLPALPRRVVVVTSRDGAALADFLRTRAQRWPDFPLRLVHTLVQGKGAAREIAAAIARADADADPERDVIAVIRGGGSLEDLWAFNELPVAEAVWNA